MLSFETNNKSVVDKTKRLSPKSYLSVHLEFDSLTISGKMTNLNACSYKFPT